MSRDRGFTLLEVLVALVVLGFVAAGLAQGLRFGLQATDRLDRQSMQRGDIEAVDRLLRRLITQMDPGTSRTPNRAIGMPGSFAFTTDLGAAAGALGTTAARVTLRVDSGTLALAWRAAPHVTPLAAPPPPETRPLLDGIARLELAYWSAPPNAAPAWSSSWDQPTLPLLVRIRLIFPVGSNRHWPDIVAAPIMPKPLS